MAENPRRRSGVKDGERERTKEKERDGRICEEHRGRSTKTTRRNKSENMTDETIAQHTRSTPIEVKPSEEQRDTKQKKTTVRRMKSIEKDKGKRHSSKEDLYEKPKKKTVKEAIKEKPKDSARHRKRESGTIEETPKQNGEENNQPKHKQKYHIDCGKTLNKSSMRPRVHPHCFNEPTSVKTSKHRTENRREGKPNEETPNHKDTKLKDVKRKEKIIRKKEKSSRERHHYSDSEIEQNRTTTNINDTTRKSGDSSAFYNLFGKNDNDSENDKDRIVHSRKSHSKESSLQEQSSIRNKLIKVLFKRVKELLKETEQLREERKTLTQKVDELIEEVEIMKIKEEEQEIQGRRVKERIDVINDGVNIPGAGKTLKQEIHGILYNIQQKYASQWQEHEKKIQQMQSHAENEIQSLMENIVGKYVQINEMKNRACATDFSDSPLLSKTTLIRDDIANKENARDIALARYTNPLFINTIPLEETRQHYLPREHTDLLLKVAEPRCSSNITSALTSFDKIDQAKVRLIQEYSQPSVDIARPQSQYISVGGNTTNANLTKDLTKAKYSSRPAFSLIPKKVALKKDEEGKKDDLKEFWRHRLLQPNPTETLQKEKGIKSEGSVMRNQF